MQIGDAEADSFSGDSYFPTLIFSICCSQHEALNQHLLELIYAERERDQEGIERSNFRKLGGWHSHNNLHREEAYIPLVDRIHLAGQKISRNLGYHPEKHLIIRTMWSIVNPPGCWNKSHNHPGCLWSGVYYVHTPENSGDIEFTDPRTAQVMNQPSFEPKRQRSKDGWTTVRFVPKAGNMIIFPSWLYHAVDPNLSEAAGKAGERVIISFNLSQMAL